MNKSEVYSNAVSELKAEPFNRAALLTLGGHLVKLLAVWPAVTTWAEVPDSALDKDVVYNEAGSPMHPAWAMTHVDFKGWAQLAQVNEDVIWNSWQGLARLNLIYPDNTLPHDVESYLLLRANDLLSVD